MPGVGQSTGERCSSQARAICPGVAPCAAAIRAHSGSAVREPLPSGNQGRKAMPRASHSFSHAIEAVSGVLTGEEGLALYARVRAEGEAVLTAAGIAYTGEEEQKKARDNKIRFEPFDGSERGGGSS